MTGDPDSMNVIAKDDESRLARLPPEHPVHALWLDPQHGLIAQVAAAIGRCPARASGLPAQAVVLLPYAQLMPLAQKLWSLAARDGFAPRFETTQNWAHSIQGFAPGPRDITFDKARDGLTAQTLLERAGLGAQRGMLAGRLVESAHQLAATVSAIAPAQRSAWVARARAVLAAGQDVPLLALEAALARVALE
ncbi:MAG: hypothetical protein ACREWJ_02315, partial [Rhodoferax sp.]